MAPSRYGLVVLVLLLNACEKPAPVDPAAHRAAVETWRSERLESLTRPDGWLSLVGLLWLEPGEQSLGRGPAADLRLDNANLPPVAGAFRVAGGVVSFAAAPGVPVQHGDRPVTSLTLAPDTSGEPTVLRIGTLEFYVIDRDGRLGVRLKDSEAPARADFQGLEYFPIDSDWRVTAELVPYEPAKRIPILNVLGMQVEMTSPGALVFELQGKEYRLDPVLEEGTTDWFVMLADETSGHETYGAGRYLYVTPPRDGRTVIDFNKAYNPPCAFSNFATCPLPPPQNRLPLSITAGEKAYGSH
ncbi:MAG TPA: DUF1684 domain-containing protein [Woeseiaceae bacterium]|nr:DUF1684 domain-containing protein [Woeseiaceae bacterium]